MQVSNQTYSESQTGHFYTSMFMFHPLKRSARRVAYKTTVWFRNNVLQMERLLFIVAFWMPLSNETGLMKCMMKTMASLLKNAQQLQLAFGLYMFDGGGEAGTNFHPLWSSPTCFWNSILIVLNGIGDMCSMWLLLILISDKILQI